MEKVHSSRSLHSQLKKILFVVALAALAVLHVLSSCVSPATPRISRILYDGRDVKGSTEVVEILRTKQVSVETNTPAVRITWRLDGQIIASGDNLRTIRFRDYEGSAPLKDLLSKAFFASIHELEVEVSLNNRSVKEKLRIRLLNQGPQISFIPEEVVPQTEKLIVRLADPEGDTIVSAGVEVTNLEGVVVYRNFEAGESYEIPLKDFRPDTYVLRVFGQDRYEERTEVRRYLRLREGLRIVRVLYEGKNIKYYSEPYFVTRDGEFLIETDASTATDLSVQVFLNGIPCGVVNATNVSIPLKLKLFNRNIDIPWSEFFEGRNVTLEFKLFKDNRVQDVYGKVVRIENQKPEVRMSELTPSSTEVVVNITDPDGDELRDVLVRVINSAGQVVREYRSVPATIRLSELPRGTYRIVASARDEYGAYGSIERMVNTSAVNSIERVSYEGQSMLYMAEPVPVTRSGRFEVTVANPANARYTIKLDNITLESSRTSNTFRLREYNDKLELSSGFFAVNHTLVIELWSQQNGSWLVQDSYSKVLKIENQRPSVSLTSSATSVTVQITEPDEDPLTENRVFLLKDDGTVIQTYDATNVTISISNLQAGDYRIRVVATDLYGAREVVERSVSSFERRNNRPNVQILQPYNNELTPTNVTVRWRGSDPDPDDVLSYELSLKEGSNEILTLTTSATEAVLSNLNLNTTYSVTVVVKDLFGATNTATVNFMTRNTYDYAYIINKSFDNKSAISIVNTFDPENVKVVGSFLNPDGVIFTDLDVAEDYIYAVGGRFLYVIDSKDKRSPRLASKLTFQNSLTAIRLYKNFAIVGEGTAGISLVDLTDPANPRLNSRTFGQVVTRLNLQALTPKVTKLPNSGFGITRGEVCEIKVFGTKAYIALEIGGLVRLNLENAPNITVNDVVQLVQANVSSLDVGTFRSASGDIQVLAFSEGRRVRYIRLEDSNRATSLVPDASVTSLLPTFDTDVRKVRVQNDSIYALSTDRFRKWRGSTAVADVDRLLFGADLNDLMNIGSYSLLLDGSSGLKLLFNDVPFDDNRIYEARDVELISNHLFIAGDGWECNGLYVADYRDPQNPVVRRFSTGDDKYYVKLSAAMKVVPKTSSERKAYVVALTNNNVTHTYEYDFVSQSLTMVATLTHGLNSVVDVSVGPRGETYVLGTTNSGRARILQFSWGSSPTLQASSAEMPLFIQQSQIPVPSATPTELVVPKSISVVPNYLSPEQEILAILVGLGPAGSRVYTRDPVNQTNLVVTHELRTAYYVVEDTEAGPVLRRYNPGNDQAVIADRFFDRIFIADGDFNGIWMLDRSGQNLLNPTDDRRSSVPYFPAAPARNVYWHAGRLFVSGGGFGVSIVDVVRSPEKISEILFSGSTYAFHSVADDKYLYVSTDRGIVTYDITNVSQPRPLTTLNLPMFKIVAR